MRTVPALQPTPESRKLDTGAAAGAQTTSTTATPLRIADVAEQASALEGMNRRLAATADKHRLPNCDGAIHPPCGSGRADASCSCPSRKVPARIQIPQQRKGRL